MAVVATVVVGAYLYVRVDEEIRRRVEEKIASKYPELIVHVRSARLVSGEGIEVRGLSISERGGSGPQAELAYFDEMLLACQTSLDELVQHDPRFTKIVIRRPLLRATRQPDGSWSTARLLPIPYFGPRSPIIVENAMVEITDPQNKPAATLTLRDINLTMTPNGPDDAGGLDVQGSGAGDHLRRVEWTMHVEPGRTVWAANGAVDGLDVSSDLRAALPNDIAERLSLLNAVRGQGRLTFNVSSDPSGQAPMLFQVAAELTGGRLDDPRLPYPLTDLHVTARCDNSGFMIDELTARNGPTTLRLACRGGGLTRNSPLVLEAETKDLVLSRQWADILPDSLRDLWAQYLPAGEVDANFRLAYDGQNWKPQNVSIKCLDTSFTYAKFPYRMQHGTGTIELHDDKLTLQVGAFAANEQVSIRGEFTHPGPAFTGWVEVKGDNIPLDQNLYVALPEKCHDVVASLNPQGTFNFNVVIARTDPRQTTVKQQLSVRLNRCGIRFDKFPYPISNITGRLEMTDGYWTFKNLEGTNDTGRISCQGEFRPMSGGGELLLSLAGTDIVMEEALHDALGPGMQRLWNEMKPRGSINLRSEINYATADKKLDLTIHIEPVAETASIQPACFPYRLEKLQGEFDYRDGHADFQKLRGIHERTTVSTSGDCDFQPDGTWQVHFKNMTADRLRADRDLIAALPARLRKAVVELNPIGPINLRGAVNMAGSGRPDTPVTSQWDVEFDMQRGSLDCGVKLENIYGAVRLTGGWDGQQFYSKGELAIDSLTWKELQFTEVRGPLWMDDEIVLLGTEAERRAHGRGARRVTAKLFGGVVLGDCWVSLKGTPRFGVQAVLTDADLNRLAVENMAGKQKLRGKVLATIDLGGTAEGRHTLAGKGSVRLRDADVYELPVMVAMLKILSVRPPDTTAFTSSDIDYRIEGDHMYFDKINFNGDAVSLVGKGEMNFDLDVKLTFHGIVGRPEMQLPIIKTVVGQASKQLMLVHMDGNLSNPKVTEEPFPTISRTIQTLQGDPSAMAGPAPLPIAPRTTDAATGGPPKR